jgi:hypothetical protein
MRDRKAEERGVYQGGRTSTKRRIPWLGVILLAATLSNVACGYRADVKVSREKIQNLIEKKFPIEKDAVLAKLSLHSPKVLFHGGSQIGMRLQYDAALLGKHALGEIAFHGPPVYKPEEGAFYLSALTIDEFTINDDSLSHKEKLRDRVSSVLDKVIPHVPLYRLRQQDFKQKLAKLLLKQVRVGDEDLVLTMGL